MALVYHMNAFSQSRIPIKYDLLQRQRHSSLRISTTGDVSLLLTATH